MKRRYFLNKSMLGMAAMAVAPVPAKKKKNKLIKPPRLKKGATIGLITPGSYLDDDGLEKAVKNLEDLGFKVKLSNNIRKRYGYVAGSDAQRLSDLHEAFDDSEIDAVWCARGGYGCSRLLPGIDFNLIRRSPKILIGFSDITAFLNAIHIKTGLVTFHGPVAASTFTDFTKAQVKAVLIDGKASHNIPLASNVIETGQVYTKHPKTVKGTLIGGNLSLLAAMAGTEFSPDFKNKIAFIEDVGEKPYRIDRMLTTLRQACRLGESCGIVLGDFSGCDAEGEGTLTLNQTFEDRLSFKGVPVGYRFPFGHTDDQGTLPMGTNVSVDFKNKTIQLLEAAVI